MKSKIKTMINRKLELKESEDLNDFRQRKQGLKGVNYMKIQG